MAEKTLRIERAGNGLFEVIDNFYTTVEFTGSISDCYAFIKAKQDNLL